MPARRGEDMLKRVASLLAIAALLVAAPSRAGHHTSMEFLGSFVKAWNSRDHRALADMWLNEGFLVTLDGQRLAGRDEIRGYLLQLFRPPQELRVDEKAREETVVVGEEATNPVGKSVALKWSGTLKEGSSTAAYEARAVLVKTGECFRLVTLELKRSAQKAP